MYFTTFQRNIVRLSVAGALLASSSAQALISQAYLSEVGNDGFACTLAAPCRTLPAALAQVSDGGEILILDSATFNTGTVVVNKSVTIHAVPGAVGGLIGSGGDALVINTVGVRVTLRGLAFLEVSGGTNGVNFANGAELTVRDSSFSGFPAAGLFSNAAGSRMQIYNSSFNDNGYGVRVFNGRVTMVDNDLQNNSVAIQASGNGGASLNPPNGTTMVRVSGGNIIDNALAFHMDATSLRASGQCNGSNIYLRYTQSGLTVHLVGNTNYVAVTGASDYNAGCAGPPVSYTIDTYQSPAK